MVRNALALLAGMLLATRLPALPPLPLIGAVLALGAAGAALRAVRLPAVALAGAAWFALHAHWQLADRLPAADDRTETTGVFVIEDFPRRRGRAMTFVARSTEPSLPQRIRLNWYEPAAVPRIGERWRFTVVLRAPRGLVNPGGFDYERWLFTRGIGATGYVRGEGRRLDGPGPGRLAWWRSRLESGLAAVLPEGPGRGVMVALATGSRHRLDGAATELFQATGTSHLMAISGLHVGLVAGLVFALAGRLPGSGGRDRAALLAMIAATAYGLLAGFGTPVRRALLMLATLLLAGRWRRPVGPATGLSLALVVVLLLQPLDCLTPGFALSFGAVAAILAIAAGDEHGGAGTAGAGRVRALVSLQWRLWLLLLPLTFLFFDRIAWAAIPANLIAIPAFGLFIVPATLAGGVAAALGGLAETPAAWLLGATHAVLGFVLTALEWLAALPGAGYRPPGHGPLAAVLPLLADRSLKVPFLREAFSYLQGRGFEEDSVRRYFELVFQLRRAYFFIDRGLVGRSAAMQDLRRQLWNNVFTRDLDLYNRHLWDRMEDFSTMLLGETGTGKGTAAAAIGRSGFIPFDPRSGRFVESFPRSFVSLNLSQFPENLIESELFGHRKGSFTGAVDDYEGVFDRCSPHGAIFLDEIGEVSIPVQIKLLKVLQERSFRPVGSPGSHRFHGRVIAATNRPIDTLRSSGGMRDDFYYRLCSDIVTVPPLRERIRQDTGELGELTALLVERMLGTPSSAVVTEVLEVIDHRLGRDYPWPGNVRELEQCIRSVLLNGRYQPCPQPPRSVGDFFLQAVREGELSASQLLGGYCLRLHRRHGSYEAVGRITGLDRRTVKKYMEHA